MRTRFEIYCDILFQGLLDIRNMGAQGEAEYCSEQADHLHNLPGLLTNMKDEAEHEHYWDCMRPHEDREVAKPFAALWVELQKATAKEHDAIES